MNQVFRDIYSLVWKEVFPNIPEMDLEKFKKIYLKGIYVPTKHQSALDPSIEVYSSPEYGYKKIMARSEEREVDGDTDWMRPKENIASLKDVLGKMSKSSNFYFAGSRELNSEIIEASDDINSSSYIYGSMHIYDCSKLLFGYNNVKCEYMVATKGSKESSFGIRVCDSGATANCFEVHWSDKISNSFFCFGCVDVRDCLFCFRIKSKQYCIANMQFEKEEYFRLKEQILQEYFAQLDDPNGFKTLADL